MRILIIGGQGTIGQAIAAQFDCEHDLILIGRSPQPSVDIADPASIERLYQAIGSCDAIVCAAGGAAFHEVSDLTPDNNETAIRSKLLGQVNLVLIGQHYLATGGSFTLTTGVMTDEPIRHCTSAAMANGGVEAFVRSAALGLANGQRLNAVSPGLLNESRDKYGAYFPGFETVSAARVARAYVKSLTGPQNGQIVKVR